MHTNCFITAKIFFIDVLQGSTEETSDTRSLEDPDNQISIIENQQPQAEPLTTATPSTEKEAELSTAHTLSSEKENCATLSSSKENYNNLVTNWNPVNLERAKTPTAQEAIVTPGNVLRAANRSPLSELLVYPTPTKKKTESKRYAARVLTSAESIALLEEKKRKKLEEIEEKQQKKRKER